MIVRDSVRPSIQRSSCGDGGPLNVVILSWHIPGLAIGACFWNTHDLGFCVNANLSSRWMSLDIICETSQSR